MSYLRAIGLQDRVTPSNNPGYFGTLHINRDPSKPMTTPSKIIRVPISSFGYVSAAPPPQVFGRFGRPTLPAGSTFYGPDGKKYIVGSDGNAYQIK